MVGDCPTDHPLPTIKSEPGSTFGTCLGWLSYAFSALLRDWKRSEKMKNKRDSEKINATNAFLTDRGISIFYENCDFLTVKLNRRVPFVETLLGIVPNSDVLVLDF